MDKINLGIVFGGASSEYEISLLSATSVLKNINAEQYNIHKIGITKEGEMFYYEGDDTSIAKNRWLKRKCTPCVISPDRAHHGLLLLSDPIEIIRLDCVFPVLHGKNGEDGTIQGLLTMAGIPFVGCDSLSSAMCMDKCYTHTVLDSKGIKTAPWKVIVQNKYFRSGAKFVKEVEEELGFPCFVKPANAGSSVGVSKAKNADELRQAIEYAFFHDKKVLVEKNIVGKEIECAVLGNARPIASCLGEIEPCNDFYDYDAKYLANKTVTHIPARIADESAKKIQSVALKAYGAMGCSGFSRIDFFLTDENEIILNEINTIPGFTAISMYPKLFENSGIPYSTLIDKLINFAMERK